MAALEVPKSSNEDLMLLRKGELPRSLLDVFLHTTEDTPLAC